MVAGGRTAGIDCNGACRSVQRKRWREAAAVRSADRAAMSLARRRARLAAALGGGCGRGVPGGVGRAGELEQGQGYVIGCGRTLGGNRHGVGVARMSHRRGGRERARDRNDRESDENTQGPARIHALRNTCAAPRMQCGPARRVSASRRVQGPGLVKLTQRARQAGPSAGAFKINRHTSGLRRRASRASVRLLVWKGLR